MSSSEAFETIPMNEVELKKIMKEIEDIINQLAACDHCKQGVDVESKRLLSQLFREKLEQACQLKRAS
jgi:recombinational DNA repair protein RecR